MIYRGVNPEIYSAWNKIHTSLVGGYDTFVKCGDDPGWARLCFDRIKQDAGTHILTYQWPCSRGDNIMLVMHTHQGKTNEDYLGLLKRKV